MVSSEIQQPRAAAADAAGIDPITAAVIQGALRNIAIEMGYKLMRMSYSSIIRESEDFGAAVVDEHGRQLSESIQSTPLQSGPIPGYVQGVLKQFAERGEQINPGDVIMHNDPYGGASHGPDVAFIVPCFHKDELVGFACTTAHHLDIGAHSPGSAGIVDAVDVYAEGLQFKSIKVYDRGQKVGPVWQILRDNLRAPDMVVGDMEAHVAASRIGAQRYLDLIDRYGLDKVRAASEELMAYSERMMRKAISELPDGTYPAHTFIDGFEHDDDPNVKNLKIAATITIKGDEMIVDLSGTAKQLETKAINMPYVGTVDVAVWLAIRSVLLDSAVVGEIPQNSGLTRPITITSPEGLMCNPIFPAPVIARFCPGNALSDTVMKSLSQAVPKQVSAGIGNLKVLAFSGYRNNTHWVHMEICEGAYGGRHGMDGMDAVDTLYANTRNNPIEDLESHLPLRILKYELREDVCGAGKWRGGMGTIREFQMLGAGGVSVEGEGHVFKPWGLEGGNDGHPAGLLMKQGNQTTSLPSKLPYKAAQEDAILVAVGPSGGGYGNPFERDPKKVLDDVLDELITAETAKHDYGVVIADGQIDMAATERLRAAAH